MRRVRLNVTREGRARPPACSAARTLRIGNRALSRRTLRLQLRGEISQDGAACPFVFRVPEVDVLFFPSREPGQRLRIDLADITPEGLGTLDRIICVETAACPCRPHGDRLLVEERRQRLRIAGSLKMPLFVSTPAPLQRTGMLHRNFEFLEAVDVGHRQPCVSRSDRVSSQALRPISGMIEICTVAK